MKNLIFLFFLIPACLFSNSSTDSIAIKNRFLEYSKAVENKDFKKMLNYLSPKVFSFFDKETMLNIITESMNSEDMKIDINNISILKVSEISIIDSESYAVLKYSSETTMHFPSLENFEGYDNEYFSETVDLLKMQHGEENVNFNKEKNQVTIKATANVFCTITKNSKNWTFLDGGYLIYLEDVLPENIANSYLTF